MKKRFILTRIRQRLFGEKERSETLIKLINENNYKTYVEVGVWKGVTAEKVAKKCPNLKRIYLVDPYDAKLGYEKGSIYDKTKQNKVTNAKKLMLSKMKRFEKVTYLLMTSEKASKKIIEKSIDIIFIDAQHTYKEVKKDISFWRKIVKNKGVLCGHDYNNRYKSDVVRAVDEYFNEKEIMLFDDAVWAVRIKD